MMQFHFSQTLSATVTFKAENASLLRGVGIHQLRLWAAVKGRDLTESTLLQITRADLSVNGNPAPWLSSAAATTTWMYDGADYGFVMAFPLTDAQIRGIEELREGRDLILRVDATAFVPARPDGGTVDASATLTVPASSWRTLIERADLGFSVTAAIDLAGASAPYREAAERLKEAQGLLNAGQVDAALTKVRQALERTREIAKSEWPYNRGDRTKFSQGERWRAILESAMGQASGSVHDDELTKTFTYRRAEAEALIAIAVSILKAAPAPMPSE